MPQVPSRRSRVRTGCLTCRSRKVKCDESRPFCYNCTRLNRACLYQPPILSDFCLPPTQSGKPSGTPRNIGIENDQGIYGQIGDLDSSENATGQPVSLEHPTPISWSLSNLESTPGDFNFMTGEWGDLFQAIGEQRQNPELSTISTPGSDLNNLNDALLQVESHFDYFLSHVQPPFITPWDTTNWTLMKAHICQLAVSYPIISASIVAIESLYRSITSGGDTAVALPQYFVAKSAYLSLLKDSLSDVEMILLVTFLLCCFEIVAQHETVSNTLKQEDIFVTRLEQRPSRIWSPICCRIISWLHLFHTKAMHLGGRGVLSPKVLQLLQEPRPLLPLTYLRPSPPGASEIAVHAFQQVLYQFYYELQFISIEVSALNRHHRPRGSSEDERTVADMSEDIQQRLTYLWQGRPWLLEVPAEDMNEIVSCPQTDLEDLKMLATLCKISYYSETIYHARGHGRSAFGSTHITSARREIRKLVLEVREVTLGGNTLHPAFIWPLFLYTVESTTSEDVDWGLENLELISNNLWSSTKIKELIRGLAQEQVRKAARVDSRYFCIEKFGVVPPFI